MKFKKCITGIMIGLIITLSLLSPSIVAMTKSDKNSPVIPSLVSEGKVPAVPEDSEYEKAPIDTKSDIEPSYLVPIEPFNVADNEDRRNERVEWLKRSYLSLDRLITYGVPYLFLFFGFILACISYLVLFYLKLRYRNSTEDKIPSPMLSFIIYFIVFVPLAQLIFKFIWTI